MYEAKQNKEKMKRTFNLQKKERKSKSNSHLFIHSNRKSHVVQKYKTIIVDQQVEQNLTDPGKSDSERYAWKSNFYIYIYNEAGELPRIQVVIWIKTAVEDSAFTNWQRQIANSWSNKFAIQADKDYPITVEIARLNSEALHYDINAVDTGQALGGRGLFGTSNMLTWGVNDYQDIPHEVGHMLGNKDEYGIVDGKDYNRLDYSHTNDNKNVMRKGDEPVRERHFNLILNSVKSILGNDAKLIKIIPRPVGSVI